MTRGVLANRPEISAPLVPLLQRAPSSRTRGLRSSRHCGRLVPRAFTCRLARQSNVPPSLPHPPSPPSGSPPAVPPLRGLLPQPPRPLRLGQLQRPGAQPSGVFAAVGGGGAPAADAAKWTECAFAVMWGGHGAAASRQAPNGMVNPGWWYCMGCPAAVQQAPACKRSLPAHPLQAPRPCRRQGCDASAAQ